MVLWMVVIGGFEGYQGERLRLLTGFCERAQGLLKTGRRASPVMLSPCFSVHTFGMAYALDIAFIGGSGRVLKVCRAIGPHRLLAVSQSVCVVERPHRRGPWLVGGERVRFLRCVEGEGSHVHQRQIWLERYGRYTRRDRTEPGDTCRYRELQGCPRELQGCPRELQGCPSPGEKMSPLWPAPVCRHERLLWMPL